MRTGRTVRAFSLLEIVFSLLLIGLVVGLGILQTRPGGSGADSKSLALRVSAELRAARARAMREKVPVAVVFPSDDGTRPHSRSLYNLVGTRRAKITRSVDFSKDSGACVAVATWPLASGTPELDSPRAGSFAVEGWPRTPTRDFIFAYTAEGAVFTNDLPLFDGQYHIVVATALDYAPAGTPSGTPTMSTQPGYFDLTAVRKPVTLSITPSGAVTLKEGLVGGNLPATSGVQQPPAAPILPSSMPNTDPLIEGVTVRPAPVNETAAGFDAVLPLPRNGFSSWLELTVLASDAEGDALTCEWTSTPITGTDPGRFTVVGEVKLPAADSFTWNWYPPYDAAAGDRFRLIGTLTDELGASVSLNGTAAIDVEMRNNGLIVYQKPRSGRLELWLDFADGPPTREITPFPDKDAEDARISPDGTKVVCAVKDGPGRDLYIMNLNGTGARPLVAGPQDEFDGAWSQDGTQVVYSESVPAPAPRLMKVGAGAQGDETKASVLSTGGWIPYTAWDPASQITGWNASWSRDGTKIAFISDSSGDPEVWVMNSDGTGLITVAGDPARESQPRWSPDGGMLMFLSDRGGGTRQVYTVNLADLSVTQRTSDATPKVDAAWSPFFDPVNGGQILYSSARGGGVLDLVQADMLPTGAITAVRNLGVSGLTEGAGADPDWGP